MTHTEGYRRALRWQSYVNDAHRKVASTSRAPKLVVKIAPDLSEPELLDIASVIKEGRVDGVIVSVLVHAGESRMS